MNIKAFVTVIFLAASGFLFAQAPTLWRGPHGNGNYDDKGLLRSWPAEGPQILWSYDQLGAGFSSPVVANSKIYLSGTEENMGYVYALSNEGKLLWKVPYAPEFTESYPGSRSSPVIAGNLLYQYSGLGVVTCMDSETGKVKWKKDTFQEFGGRNVQWGVTETFAIDGNKLFVTPGGPEKTVVALDRMTGALLWSAQVKGDLSGYCTPLVVKIPGRTLLVTHTASHIAGLDAQTGKLLWTFHHPNQWSVQANTPIYHDGALFCFSGYGQGGVKLRLSADGTSVHPEWVSKSMDNRIGGAVLVNGYIYGSGDQNRYWMAIDWKTGEEKYQAKGLANGTVISADGLLFGYTDRGELFMAEADPGGLNILGKTKVSLGTAQHWAHLVIDNGRLLVRHGNALIVYKIR
ncbi:MAG: PQQ-binding-like beta-propeller repeat protein [Prolixibacteraceae bacterium]|jgi:outer membrane protein assembly factor BamB|nr:PQQ-like beta-propeller repeat protein [Prolixibacteraceae bacterium]MDI9563821.1 PQQ-like beta-propeller repeat protein [Bacteroidota bacterium]NLS99960.1 PQQ-binding-like beta-propeller repeat protein [Bacteroidales bacterium]OQB81648.1 MAG: outer membrane biogenesis protein BamB [Bacteroidetes bacterium ADurb.Bin123]HNU78240.1 PQQ-like beta-propeller repeat protein [Prolixibacteraceae bacterium]